MKKVVSILFLSSLLIFIGCKSDKCQSSKDTLEENSNIADKNWQEITDEHFFISVPSNMEMVNYLNPEASVQFHQKENDIFMMIIKEPVKEADDIIKSFKDVYQPNANGLSNYKGYFLRNLSKMPNYQLIKEEDIKLDGCDAKHLQFYVKSQIVDKDDKTSRNADLFFNNALVQSGDNYFQIITWTLKEKESENKNTLEKIIQSFKQNNIR